MREDNIALLRRGYEAFASGDLDTIQAMGAADEVWHTPGIGPFRSEYRGVDSVVDYLATLMTATDGTFRSDPEAFTADDDSHVAVVEHITAERMGRKLDTHVIHVYEVADHKVVDITEYDAEPDKLREFWA
jgi:ketosteroid isomerase-like protein